MSVGAILVHPLQLPLCVWLHGQAPSAWSVLPLHLPACFCPLGSLPAVAAPPQHCALLIAPNGIWLGSPGLTWVSPALFWKTSLLLSSLIPGPPIVHLHCCQLPLTLLAGGYFFCPPLTWCFWDFSLPGHLLFCCRLAWIAPLLWFHLFPAYRRHLELYTQAVPLPGHPAPDRFVWVPHKHLDLFMSEANYCFPQSNSSVYFS